MILFDAVSSSQIDTESVVVAAGTDTAISHHPPCAPDEKVVLERGELDFRNSLFLEILA